MRHVTLLFLGVILLGKTQAQISADSIKAEVQKLKLTSAPAFVILGVEPDNIERPTTPRDFALSLQNAVVNQELKPNMAIETTPYYWFHKQPKAATRFANQGGFTDYLVNKGNAWKHFSLSLATSPTDSVAIGQLQPGTGLGFGMKSLIVPGKIDDKVRKALEATYLESALANYYDNLIGFAEAQDGPAVASVTYRQALRNAFGAASGLVDQYHDISAGFRKNLKKRLEEIHNELLGDLGNNEIAPTVFKKAVADRKKLHVDAFDKSLSTINGTKNAFARFGFMLEAAAGTAIVFQKSEWGSAMHARTSIWVTPSYRWNLQKVGGVTSSLDAMAVFRYTGNRAQVDSASYLDFGGKIQFNRNRLNLGFEFIGRNASKVPDTVRSNWTYRAVLAIDYTIMENITLSTRLGTNFDGNSATYDRPDKLLAIAGAKFGLFNVK